MGQGPPSFITFRRKGETARPQGRVELYQLALELSSSVYAVIELAELERYFLRDALDKKSTLIPVLITRGLSTPDMNERRAHYLRARTATIDCSAILDILAHRGTVVPEVLEAARTVATALAQTLEPLTVPPPMTR